MLPLYSPPAGFYDAPFTWIFDGSGLTDASNALNIALPIYAGYGDFVMRRVVGLDNVLNASTGQFQYYDKLRRALQEVPQDINNGGEFATVPEIVYPENSSIYFDLWNVSRNIVGGISKAFVAFQGARRKPGNGIRPAYQFKPKTLTYSIPVAVPGKTGLNLLNQAPVSIYQEIQDYDFDLYQIILTYAPVDGEPPASPTLALWVYDSDSQRISNLPVMDIYLNGAPGSKYAMGAIVPPLFFQQGSQLHVDLYSLVTFSVTVTVHFVGMRRIPC